MHNVGTLSHLGLKLYKCFGVLLNCGKVFKQAIVLGVSLIVLKIRSLFV